MSVQSLRDAAESTDPDLTLVPPRTLLALCDLADAARERRSVSTCEWCNDTECTGSGICPCDYACHDAEYRADVALDAALARLDGEDTG